jgi:hypothetical protein
MEIEGCRIDARVDTVTVGRMPLQAAPPRHRAAASCKGENFIPDQVESNSFTPGLIQKKAAVINHIAAQVLQVSP